MYPPCPLEEGPQIELSRARACRIHCGCWGRRSLRECGCSGGPISFEPPVHERAVFRLARRLGHEPFKPRSNPGLVKSHGSLFRLESLGRLPFLWCSDALGIVPRMNDGTVRIAGGIKADTAFHPDRGPETGCRRFTFGGTALLELLPAAARTRIISSDYHLAFLWPERDAGAAGAAAADRGVQTELNGWPVNSTHLAHACLTLRPTKSHPQIPEQARNGKNEEQHGRSTRDVGHSVPLPQILLFYSPGRQLRQQHPLGIRRITFVNV